MTSVPVSFLIPVKNEAANLPRCLASIAWADDVWVVDSQSTDATAAIAEAAGADHEIHEPMIVDGKIGRLRSEMAHYAFPTIESFVERHNVYSNWEAQVTLSDERTPPSHDFGWRQRLKRWSRHLPCRPLLRFLFVYVWQRGFLDGRAGYYFARLHAMYEFLSVAKTYELRLRRNEDTRLGH